ncbi:MAG: DUF502 domain-containing protein [Bacteroidota bacterium]|jgi:uncharacterized membrane protein
MNPTIRKIWKRTYQHFLQGLFYTAPIGITIFLLVKAVLFIDSIFKTSIPGVGILAILIGITTIGWITTKIIHKPLLQKADLLIEKTPLVKVIYTSVKDLVSAFVGQKKKFDKPVLVTLDNGLERIGFIMQENLSFLNIEGQKVAVYFPMSVSIAGDLYIVEVNRITPLETSSSDMMKFIMSGGLTS